MEKLISTVEKVPAVYPLKDAEHGKTKTWGRVTLRLPQNPNTNIDHGIIL